LRLAQHRDKIEPTARSVARIDSKIAAALGGKPPAEMVPLRGA
jgi:hypothetical protein